MGDTATGSRLDTMGMLDAAAALPEQVERAAEVAAGLSGLPGRQAIENVVVLGMGGSGIAGDILLHAAGPFMPVPVVVVKSAVLPAFVSDATLVFAVSFSGDTDETVEAATEAAVQGAHVVAVTRGGELGRLADAWGAPVIPVPGDIPAPRAAIGALAVPPLVVLHEIGLFPGAGRWIAQAVAQLKRRRDQLVAPGSLAERLAKRIGRTIPLVYGGGGVATAAALRWKTQFNENAKVPAFWNTQPELCHNEVAGWGQHGDLTRQAISLIALRHDDEHPQIQRRFELVYELMEEVVASITEVRAEGEGKLAQLFDLVLIGDFTSIHLALREGVDPGPVPALDHVKAGLTAR
jgi:glucose/mannose-6-phosphate isomerase